MPFLHDSSTYRSTDLKIRPYMSSDERQWLRCSVLSFLDTAYYDSVFRHKPRYEHPAIELVAEYDDTVVGVVDIECEEEPGTVCTVCSDASGPRPGAMIWHLAVHPDFQRRGIGAGLLRAAMDEAARRGIECFEVWTRDDAETLRWYEKHGFEWVKSYLHVYLQGREEIAPVIESRIPALRPVRIFAHYEGPDDDAIRSRFERVHECNCFRLWI